MCFTSDDFLKETCSDYWQWSYLPVYVDVYDENTRKREVFVVENIRYGEGIELVVKSRDDVLKDILERREMPSLVNVGNLIGICRNHRMTGRVADIYYKIGIAGQLRQTTDVFEKVHACSNSAEWHFIVFK